MTKKQILERMGLSLKHYNMEVCVVDFPELHEIGTRYHAYAIGYDTDSYNAVVVRPWSGADYAWPLDVKQITKERLSELYGRVMAQILKNLNE